MIGLSKPLLEPNFGRIAKNRNPGRTSALERLACNGSSGSGIASLPPSVDDLLHEMAELLQGDLDVSICQRIHYPLDDVVRLLPSYAQLDCRSDTVSGGG